MYTLSSIFCFKKLLSSLVSPNSCTYSIVWSYRYVSLGYTVHNLDSGEFNRDVHCVAKEVVTPSLVGSCLLHLESNNDVIQIWENTSVTGTFLLGLPFLNCFLRLCSSIHALFLSHSNTNVIYVRFMCTWACLCAHLGGLSGCEHQDQVESNVAHKPSNSEMSPNC